VNELAEIEGVEKALRYLLSSRDRRTGAVPDWSVDETGDALVRPHVTAFVSPALARFGYAEAALQHLEFLLRVAEAAGTVRGTLYTDGAPAEPHWRRDYAAVAWTLWSLAVTLEILPLGEAGLFLDDLA